MQIDPLADETHIYSPYAFANANPISGNDPSGLLLPAPNSQFSMAKGASGGFGGGGGGDVDQSLDDAEDNDGGWQSYISGQNGSGIGGGGDVGDGGGDGSGGGGGSGSQSGPFTGSGPYGSYYNALWAAAPDYGTTMYTSDPSMVGTYYDYQNASGSAAFETPSYHGIFTNTVGETYGFTGTTERYALPDYDGADAPEGGNWTTTANNVNGAFSAGWGGKENLMDYAATFDESIEDLKYFKAVKVVSKVAFGAQIAISGIQAYSAWHNSDGDLFTNDGNKWGVTGKAALDIAMAAVGTFCGPVGWVVAGTYFLIDATTKVNKWGEAPE